MPLNGLETTAHLIQVALTPVFLLSGIGTLLSVFSTRLGRVADRVDVLSQLMEGADDATAFRLGVQLRRLQRRSLMLDVAVVLGTLAGAATCGATITLFVGALRNQETETILYAMFGFALCCTQAALTAFLVEMLMASRGLRHRAHHAPELRADQARTAAREGSSIV